MSGILEDFMLVDPALRRAVMALVLLTPRPDEPPAATEFLGLIAMPGEGRKKVFLRHAADAVFLDDLGQTVLITRRENPGRGKQALPGGFLDELADGRPETSEAAAWREAMEETGVSEAVLGAAKIMPLGPRRYDRAFDIRAAWNDPPGTPIKQGEFFVVSTRGFLIRVAGDLQDLPLQAGDDAKAVHVVAIAGLTPEQFAVPDHLEMIQEAVRHGG